MKLFSKLLALSFFILILPSSVDGWPGSLAPQNQKQIPGDYNVKAHTKDISEFKKLLDVNGVTIQYLFETWFNVKVDPAEANRLKSRLEALASEEKIKLFEQNRTMYQQNARR